MKTSEKSDKYTRLIEQYFNGETTLAEEEILRSYFQKGNLLPEHLPYAPLFEYTRLEQEKIRESDCIRNQNNAPARIGPYRNRKFLFAGIAAAVTLLLLSGGILLYEKGNPEPFTLTVGGASINDQQLAVNIAKNKLEHLNGILERMNEKTEKAVNSAVLPEKLNFLERLSRPDAPSEKK